MVVVILSVSVEIWTCWSLGCVHGFGCGCCIVFRGCVHGFGFDSSAIGICYDECVRRSQCLTLGKLILIVVYYWRAYLLDLGMG